MGRSSLVLADRSPSAVLSAILSQMFPLGDHLSICGCQDFFPALGKGDNRYEANYFDIITVSVSFLVTNYTPCKLTF